ncbi:MAG: CHASE2 domain-containing protein, partial [Bdellovibrionales bacterium]
MNHSESLDRKGLWRQKVLKNVSNGIIGWIIISLLLMGPLTEELLRPLFAPLKDNGAVALAVIDSSTLDYERMEWPISYDYYAALTKKIACTEARAIFFDLTLTRESEFETPRSPGWNLIRMVRAVSGKQTAPSVT